MSGFYEVVLRNCGTGQQLLLASRTAMQFMTTVTEGADEKVCYEEGGYSFMARYDKGKVVITLL